jgi:large conductance mechanosensitive channel
MIKEFREFIARGNVLDLAIGIIIGAAFTAIVNSLVTDIINPIVGLIFGGRADFSAYYIPLAGQAAATLEDAKKLGPVLAYGSFVTAIINFLIVAFVLFLIVKAANRFRREKAAEPAAPPAPTNEEKLLGEIRDLLRDGRGAPGGGGD